MSARLLAALLALTAFVTGCTTSQLVHQPDLDVRVEDPTHGRVYLFRSGQVYGWLQDIDVWQGETKIGTLVPGEYFVWETPPGRYIVRVKADRTDRYGAFTEGLFDLQVQAGDVHHIGIRFEEQRGKPQLSEWEDTDGTKRVNELVPAGAPDKN